MEKKRRKIDFANHDNNDERLIFRFYPRQSHCHGFGSEPPKSWNDVYKVYYAYSVIRQFKDDGKCEGSDIVFATGCDECSVIDEVAEYCARISNGEKSVCVKRPDGEEVNMELLDNEIFTFAYGVDWKITDTGVQHRETLEPLYMIEMFDHMDVGYRFRLYESELAEFGKYLRYCCEYMLEHGEPI